MTQKQVIEAAERAGWECEIEKRSDGYFVSFSTDTSCGQDVYYEYDRVKRLSDIENCVYGTYEAYDPDEEAMLWYGKRGAPSSLTDLINDMLEVEHHLEALLLALRGYEIPGKEEVDFTRKANDLRVEALSALTSHSHKCHPSRFYSSSMCFDNPDKCSKYEEIVFISRWTLVDSDGLQYDIECIPLEEFCSMVDSILNNE